MTNPLGFDPALFFPTADPLVWLVRPPGPCGCCGGATWTIVRVARAGREAVEVICPRCPLQTCARAREVLLLGTIVPGGEPAWRPCGLPTTPGDLARVCLATDFDPDPGPTLTPESAPCPRPTKRQASPGAR